MGQYDGPFFDQPGVVSIWIEIRPWSERKVPADYCTPFDADDDDADFCAFSRDFRFGCFDLDQAESNCAEDGQLVSLGLLLEPVSYSASFLSAAVAEAVRQDIPQASSVWLIYDLQYDPAITGVNESPFLRFVGAFPYETYEGD